jgi:hypothetical protein
LQNPTAYPVTFNVTNVLLPDVAYVYTVQPGAVLTDTLAIIVNDSGWYDFRATSSSDPAFVRESVGQTETAAPEQPPPPVAKLVANAFDGALTLTYPLEAISQPLLCSTNLDGPWLPLNASPATVGSNAVVVVPITENLMFFRLQP